MRGSRRFLAGTAAMAALIAAAAFAQTPEEQVEVRQEQMKINGSNVRVIAGFVQKGEGTMAEVQTAANNINGVAGVIDTLWPEGTAVGVGDSRALPVIWENPDAFAESPKKSITMPMPYWPLLTASGTPNERSETCARLPPISSSSAQPLSQPSPCRMVSTVRCVVPERDGAEMPTWPK